MDFSIQRFVFSVWLAKFYCGGRAAVKSVGIASKHSMPNLMLKWFRHSEKVKKCCHYIIETSNLNALLFHQTCWHQWQCWTVVFGFFLLDLWDVKCSVWHAIAGKLAENSPLPFGHLSPTLSCVSWGICLALSPWQPRRLKGPRASLACPHSLQIQTAWYPQREQTKRVK